MDGRCVAGFTPRDISEIANAAASSEAAENVHPDSTLCRAGAWSPLGGKTCQNVRLPWKVAFGRSPQLSTLHVFTEGRRAGLEALGAAPPACKGGDVQSLVYCLSWSSWTRARPSAARPGESSQEPSGSRATSGRARRPTVTHVSTWGSGKRLADLERRAQPVTSDVWWTARSSERRETPAQAKNVVG